MVLFDAYVIVDWSAYASPKMGKDSVWIADASRDGTLNLTTKNHPTRDEATKAVEMILRKHLDRGRSVLVGFDFPYGYPAGFAANLDGKSTNTPQWRATWHRLQRDIQDDANNANNRFEVAASLNRSAGFPLFWGCPKARASDHLCSTCHNWQASRLRQFRHTDQQLRDRKLSVQEVWKLYGNGSVGSQSLLGIPRVDSLRFAAGISERSLVWPFETDFKQNPLGSNRPGILHCEIWPGIIPIRQVGTRVRDDVQVEMLSRHFAHLDERGELGQLFEKPERLSSSALRECLEEEGWILGA